MAPRTDALGRAYKKSQLQVQLWVNRRQAELDAAALAALPSLSEVATSIEWVSPLEANRFAEYFDAEFVRSIGRSDLVEPLARFWPRGGPHWDGLGIARDPNGSNLGPVFVEGKSYPAEMRSRLTAKPESRRRILARLAEARAWLGVPDTYAVAWSERYYQAANRIAHIYFFHEVLGERAWMLNLCFVNDADHPTSRGEWDAGLAIAEGDLGITGLQLPGHGRAFLAAGTRAELLRPNA
ncbi:MAG: hypothetical protein U0R70_17515 [Solirubrobacteraceae bacterium]